MTEGATVRDYGKLHTTFWTSDTTRGLSNEGKLLAMYLLLGPHTNMIGCFRLPEGYVSEDLGWGSEKVLKAFAELSRNGFATHDSASKWVFIHSFLKWNPVDNPNQGKAAAKLFDHIPNGNQIKFLVAKQLAEFEEKLPEGCLEPFRKGLETLSPPPVPDPVSATVPGFEDGQAVGESSSQPPKTRTRPRNAIFDALAEVTGLDPVLANDVLGRNSATLAKAKPPYTPDEIQEFGRRYYEFCPWAAKDGSGRRPTPDEVRKYIGLIRAKPATAPPVVTTETASERAQRESMEHARRFLARGESDSIEVRADHDQA